MVGLVSVAVTSTETQSRLHTERRMNGQTQNTTQPGITSSPHQPVPPSCKQPTMSLPPFLQTTPPPAPPPSQARLKALYASTSTQKESNPTGYQANVTWWTGIIEECLRTGWLGDHRFVLRVDENLAERFENAEGGRPKGLGGVVVRFLLRYKA